MNKLFLAILLSLSILCAIGDSPSPLSNYQAVDKYSDNVPGNSLQSIESLTKYLIKPAQNDTDKVRAIYRWIAMNISYDTQSYFSGSYRQGSADPAEDTFRYRKAVCNGYAHLFKRMCDIAEVKAEVVSGWSKGYGYEIGEKLPAESDHAWNVVWLEGKWQFIETTWGSGYLDTKTNKFIRKFDALWFLMPPERFIFTHYPEEAKWQLLGSTVSIQDWQSWGQFENDFFKYGFNPEENKLAWLRANESMALKFKVRPDVALIANLVPWGGTAYPDGYTLVKRNGETAEIIVSFPTRGTYELQLFAKYRNEPGSYEQITSYRVDVAKGNNYQTLAKTYGPYSTLPVELNEQTPIYSQLKAGYRYNFKLLVPNADQVAIVNSKDNSFQQLQRNGQYFAGEADIQSGQVSVSAHFPGEGTSYSTLLEYTGR